MGNIEVNGINTSMPVVILMGGSGIRLREETEFRPKPMIEIGGKPMIVHIINHYRKFGLSKFILALGYKANVVKEYFLHYQEMNSNVINVRSDSVICKQQNDINILLIDTGENTLKGGRINKVKDFIFTDDFYCTYGDGIGDINIEELYKYHLSMKEKTIATLTGVHRPSRFGEIEYSNDGIVTRFSEKSIDNRYVNGGFFVLNKKIFNYLDNNCDFEIGVLDKLAQQELLGMYRHEGQFVCMDTGKDLGDIKNLINNGKAEWLK